MTAIESVAPCVGLMARTDATVADTALIETSGLIRSTRESNLLWAHNDSGSTTALHALGLDGSDRGTVGLAGVRAADAEDIASADGQIYLADIGDNDNVRETVTVLRFPEPAPGDGAIDEIDVIEFRYPDGPQDAEALLADPRTGELVIITKAIGIELGNEGLVGAAPAPIYVAAPPFSPGPTTLTRAGTIAAGALDELSAAPEPGGIIGQFGLAGVVTGADISADGGTIAVRTYRTVWLFERSDGQSVADALAGVPCEAPTLPERQGEAVAFTDSAGTSFVTISEGTNPAVNITGP